MWNGKITLTASSKDEMDKRITDNEKRGYVLIHRSDRLNSWEDRAFTAVMRKEGYDVESRR